MRPLLPSVIAGFLAAVLSPQFIEAQDPVGDDPGTVPPDDPDPEHPEASKPKVEVLNVSERKPLPVASAVCTIAMTVILRQRMSGGLLLRISTLSMTKQIHGMRQRGERVAPSAGGEPQLSASGVVVVGVCVQSAG